MHTFEYRYFYRYDRCSCSYLIEVDRHAREWNHPPCGVAQSEERTTKNECCCGDLPGRRERLGGGNGTHLLWSWQSARASCALKNLSGVSARVSVCLGGVLYHMAALLRRVSSKHRLLDSCSWRKLYKARHPSSALAAVIGRGNARGETCSHPYEDAMRVR